MVFTLLRNTFLNSVYKQPVGITKIAPLSVFILRNMASTTLENLPKVDIDSTGVFKYILLKVHTKDADEHNVIIVRGYRRCEYHSDIYDEVQDKLHPLDCEPMGGGRISHDDEMKCIQIYGYSQAYGRGDHEMAAKLIKEAYPDYKISITDQEY